MGSFCFEQYRTTTCKHGLNSIDERFSRVAFPSTGTCFSDPDLCKLNGMTIYTWLKIDAKELESTQNGAGRDAYILSTGGQSKKSRG